MYLWRLGQKKPSHCQDAPCDTLLTFFPLRTEGSGSINIGLLGVHFALMLRWDHSCYQISVIFLRLTRLSTSQRYEPIKGVFHTATTRTSVLITSVPNMQSQGGQGEDCYIWWFVVFFFFFFFFLLSGTDKEMWNLSRKAHLWRHDMSHCWGRPRFVPLCLNVNKMLCWVATEIKQIQHKVMLMIRSCI